MQDLNDMVIFARVVQAGGFTAAAEILALPKSNVSRRVARLESDLGVRLLERTTRKIHVTEIGEIYFHHCLRIIEESEHADLSVQSMVAEPRGILRVSASVTTGQQLLAPLLPSFMAQFPNIELQLELTNRRIDLIEEGLDVAIRVGLLEDSRLVSRKLGVSQHHLYASQTYLDQQALLTEPEQLCSHRVLLMSDQAGAKKHVVVLNKNEQTQQISVQPLCTANDFHSLHQFAKQGMGIAVLPHYLCHDPDDKLVRVLPAWSCPSLDFHAIYPSHRGATPKLRVFLDFMKIAFANRLQ